MSGCNQEIKLFFEENLLFRQHHQFKNFNFAIISNKEGASLSEGDEIRVKFFSWKRITFGAWERESQKNNFHRV